MDSPCSRISDLNSMVSHRRLVGYRDKERERERELGSLREGKFRKLLLAQLFPDLPDTGAT